MAKSAIKWIIPPTKLSEAIGEYGDRVFVAIKALADFIAQQAQDDMRRGAPWTDRTGNARSGLFSVAEQAAKQTVIIYLSHGHTIEYGVYLELARGGRYAIIAPTMQRIYPMVERMLKALFR